VRPRAPIGAGGNRAHPIAARAGRGQHRMVQQILETAVALEGPEKAKRVCINAVNTRGQTALSMACMNG
jgi:hypothetical protein